MTMDEVWAEAFRRAGEDGRDPPEHFREMMEEALDSLVADGAFEVRLNDAGEKVYRMKSGAPMTAHNPTSHHYLEPPQ
jgi:hypothetical protein